MAVLTKQSWPFCSCAIFITSNNHTSDSCQFLGYISKKLTKTAIVLFKIVSNTMLRLISTTLIRRTQRSATNRFSNLAQKRLCCAAVDYKINLKIKDVAVNKYVENLKVEYENMLEKGETSSKRFLALQPLIQVLRDREDIVSNIRNLQELLNENDSDIRKLAEDEKKLYEEKIKMIDDNLIELLLPVERADTCNSIILEVNAGVGGQEAMLFAEELFEMYCNFADYKGWQVEIADCLKTDLGGIRHASVIISGDHVFRHFKFEAGVHRVQRVPATERSGRIHTSTVSVIALPQPEDIDVKIENQDLRFEAKRASGAGGQHVNTTDSAVRITHIPTGLIVECQVDRSQHKNRQIALQKLRALLYQKQLEAQAASEEATRKSQVRSNFRSEKIRTYNFNQDRVTDHRLQGSNLHNLKGFLEGGSALDGLINRLYRVYREEAFLNAVTDVENKSSK